MQYITRRVIMAIAAISIAIASGTLWIALSHNPQGEFCGSELSVNWTGILTLWGAAFLVAFALVAAVTWAIVKAWRVMVSSKVP